MKTSSLALVLLAALPLQAAPARVDITRIEKPADKVIVELKPQRLLFNVVSSDGIGGFQAVLKSGHWPRDVSVALNSKTLESFEFHSGTIHVHGAVVGTSLTNCWAFNLDGAPVRVTSRPTPRGLELALPPGLFSDTKKFRFLWINAYRR